ncbi:MAG: adenylyltransferase [Methylobacteriaceae bacterium]|nr:adenylyltransferase [Methylobacteriaceae bacterium]
MSVDNCEICALHAGPGMRPVLYVDDLFFIVPSLGPLHPHHLLICSRQHRTGLHQMTDSELLGLGIICESLGRVFSRIHSQTFLMFENGTSESGKGGCSISHYHMHVVPMARHFESARDPVAFRALPVQSLTEARTMALKYGDYIYLKRPGRTGTIASRAGLPSQYMRKIVAELNDVGEWDWRKSPAPSDWREEREFLYPLSEALRQEVQLHGNHNMVAA